MTHLGRIALAALLVALAAPGAARAADSGEDVYRSACAKCHAAGLAKAPKPGDKAAWDKRIAGGLGPMLKIAVHGKGAMPAKGGVKTLSDLQVARAVVYMANESGGKLKEPSQADVAKALK